MGLEEGFGKRYLDGLSNTLLLAERQVALQLRDGDRLAAAKLKVSPAPGAPGAPGAAGQPATAMSRKMSGPGDEFPTETIQPNLRKLHPELVKARRMLAAALAEQDNKLPAVQKKK